MALLVRTLGDVAGRLVGVVPGALLAGAAGVAGAVRRDKPLHPRGTLGAGTLRVEAPARRLGVPLLAEAAEHPVSARLSRAMGLPDTWRDIEGLALRLPGAGDDGGAADLLFAGTGTDPLARFVLTLRPAGVHGPQSTLLPVRTAAGPLLLLAEPRDGLDLPEEWDLSWALGRGPWTYVARLTLAWTGGDVPERFDPVRRQLAGTGQYPVVTAMREPAYLAARAAARAQADDPVEE